MRRATDYYVAHGTNLLDRYRATGHFPDLQGAVDAFRQLVLLNRPRSRDAPAGRFLLCIALRELYDATGDIEVLKESVSVGSEAAEAAREMAPDILSYATGVLNLAIALRDLGQQTADPGPVDAAIEYGRWGVTTLGPGQPLRPDAFCDLAAALSVRYQLTGDMDSLQEAIAIGFQALQVVPQGHAMRLTAPYRLTQYLEEMYRKTGDPAALDDAIKVAGWGVEISGGDPHHADHLRSLANLLRKAARDRDDPDALRRAIDLLRMASTRLPGERRNAGMILMSLGAALVSLGERTGESGATREAVHWLRQGLAASGDDDYLAGTLAHNLMLALRSLYRQTGEPDLLPEAVQAGRESLRRAPRLGAQAERAGTLAILLNELADGADDPDALEREAIGLFRSAVSSAEGDAVADYRYGLWVALRSRYNENGGVPLLEEAIEQIRAALSATGPDDSRYDEYQYSLGTSLVALYRENTEGQTLDDAVAALRAAVAAVPADDPETYRQRRASLAVALLNVWERDRAEPALEEAIDILRQVVAGTDVPSATDVSNLTRALLIEFDKTGRLASLEEAIDQGRRAAGLRPGDPTILSNLATALNELFLRTAQRSAADEALTLLRQAADAVPRAHPNAAAILSNISITMSGLAERLDEPTLAGEAVVYARQAVDSAPPGHHGRAAALNSLGSQLVDRFSGPQQLDDLREAVAVLTEAAQTPDQAARSVVRYNLARATFDLGRQLGDVALFGAAVRLSRLALEESQSPARRARICAELGLQLQWLREVSGDASLEDQILAAYAEAIVEADAPPRLRLQAARSRAAMLADAQRWTEALADYSTAIDLVSQVAARHLATSDKQHGLEAITTLGPDAAACALQAGQPQRAIELAEHGRGVLIAQAFDGQTDLLELRAHAPELAARFEALRDDLDAVSMAPPFPVTSGDDEDPMAGLTPPAERQHLLGRRWTGLLNEIREQPGFEMFLMPPPFETLAAAASGGPVVLVNVSRFRCDAVVLPKQEGGCAEVQVVPLPDVDPGQVADQAGAVLSQLTNEDGAPGTVQGTLAWLWSAVVGPVLASLGLAAGKAENPPSPLPRIWWCPTGFLSYLPLHAAGSQPGQTALDLVVSSYTPSLRALLSHPRGQGQDPGPAKSAVVVAMPDTPGALSLPAVAAEAELVAAKYPGALVLEGPRARYETVISALADHALAHFACHAVSDPDDPSRSRLMLDDHEVKPLTVSDVMRCETTAAQLAYLSACSTAQTPGKLIDEVLHITSAFQIAGFPEVIGTLWPIVDRVAAAMVRDFYAAYLPDDATATGVPAARALHRATQRARARYPDHPLLWMAHVHVGR